MPGVEAHTDHAARIPGYEIHQTGLRPVYYDEPVDSIHRGSPFVRCVFAEIFIFNLVIFHFVGAGHLHDFCAVSAIYQFIDVT